MESTPALAAGAIGVDSRGQRERARPRLQHDVGCHRQVELPAVTSRGELAVVTPPEREAPQPAQVGSSARCAGTADRH